MNKTKMALQKGFSLIELLVVIVIIGILSSVILSNMSTDKSKVTALLDNMETLQTGLARYNADTGCYPERIESLFDKSAAVVSTTAGFCQAAMSTVITDPYVDATSFNATTHAILFNKIGAGVEVSTAYSAGPPKIWYMKAAALPDNLIDLAVNSCNGDVATATPPTAWANSTKCIKSGTSMYMAFNRK